MERIVHVFGPAYLDRVVRTNGSLRSEESSPPIDQSVDGRLTFAAGLTIREAGGHALTLDLPTTWPGPLGRIDLADPLPFGSNRHLRAWHVHDDLGGMGAGFAAALGGELIAPFGDVEDRSTEQIRTLLDRQGIAHRAVHAAGLPSDWTLLVTSGACADKLAIGFRGCQPAIPSFDSVPTGPCDLRVVAGLSNRLASEVFHRDGARLRLFAPALRNMTAADPPVSTMARWIDVLCCNRQEWERLDDREQVAWQVALLAITDGARGALIRYTTPEGEPGRLTIPAFPRDDPPHDTNRAGEAFAATLVATLLDEGWRSGEATPALIRFAATRAAAASALQLDLECFGFPSSVAIDRAVAEGRVRSSQRTEPGSDPAGTAIHPTRPETHRGVSR